MNWDEYGEGRDEREPPEVDEGPEPPKAWEAREVDDGPEPPKVWEAKEMKEADEGPEPPKASEAREFDDGPEPPKASEAREVDEGPEPPEARKAREMREVDDSPEPPEAREVKKIDEGPEEPEKPELEEKDEERGERLNLDNKVENSEEVKEGTEEELQEHLEEGDAAERPDGERNEGFSKDPEKKEEGKEEEEGKQELLDEREKTGDRNSETNRVSDTNREGAKEENTSDSQFTTSREWGGRKTPGGGWSEYYAETSHTRNDRTGITSERTSIFTQGETDQGIRITEVGRQDDAEFTARLQNAEGWFDDFFVRIESAGMFQSWETDRPIDASFMQFPPGADVKSDIRITNNPDLKDLRAFGQSTEFWTDNDGFPTIRTTRWVIFQRDSSDEDGKNENPGEGGSKTRLFGYVKTDEFQLRPGKDDVTNRKSSFNMFFPLEGGGEGQSVRGNAASSSTEGKGGEGTGGRSQRVRMLFGDRGNEVSKNDYSFKGESTEVVYLPIGNDAEDKTAEAGDKTSGTTTTSSSSVAEGEGASEKETAESAVGKTSETSDASSGETGEGVSVEDNKNENDAAVNEGDETSGVSEAGKDVAAEKETSEGAVIDETDKTSTDAGEAEENAPAEKDNAGDAEEIKPKSAEGEEEAPILVEGGEDGEKISDEDALRIVGKGIFRFRGEKAYYEKLRENGVQLDGKKLARMLFVERRIPKQVYTVLKSLEEDDDKKEKREDKQTRKAKANTEPNAGSVPESSKEEKEKSTENTEENERKTQKQERPGEEEEQELGLEELFTIIQNTLKGIAYSISKDEFLKLYDEVVKKKGGEEKVAELLRRMKAGEVEAEQLYDAVRNNEVPLEFLGAFLEFVEGAKGVEERVREIVQKTIKLFKRLGRDLRHEQETGVQDSNKVEEESGGDVASVEEELERKGYAYLGELIGRLLNEKGLLDSWIFDLIMMKVKKPSQGREESEKAKDIMERFREVWERLGMDPKLKLSPIIPELYNWLERHDLLLFVYNGRVDPHGRRGRVVSRVDALETLSEAVQKTGSEAKFLEVVNKRSGRRFFQYSVDAQLAEGRLDEEILRIAVEYVYEKREKIDGRRKLLDGNTDYILKRMMEGAFFFSHLEGLLEPLAELNRQLEQFDQASKREDYTKERVESLERGLLFPNVEPQNVTEVKQGVETVEPPSADTVTSVPYDMTQKNMIPSVYEHSGVHWQEVLDNPYTTFLFPDMVEYAREVNKNLPDGQKKGIISPIILTPLKTFGLESASIGAVMLRIFQSTHWPDPLRAFIDQKLADYMNLPKPTDPKIYDNWFEKVIDASKMILDMTTGQLLLMDDFENPAGTKYWGVDVFISIVVPVGSDGCFLKVSVSIKNDKDSCDKRAAQLNRRDIKGKYVLSNEKLYGCGWAALKNHNLPDGDGPGQLWETWNSETGQGNVELLIDRTTGRILKYMIPDMTTLKSTKNEDGTDKVKGFADGELYGADNMDRVMINIPREGDTQAGSNVENRKWKGWVETHNDMAYTCFLFENLERINPIKTVTRVHVVDYPQGVESVAGFHRCLWKPRATIREYGTNTYESMKQKGIGVFDDYPLLLYLIRDLGLSRRIPEYKAKINNCPPSGEIIVPMIKSILALFNGGFALSTINPYRTHRAMDWTTITDFVYQNFMKLELDVMTGSDRKASERISYLSLFFDAVQDYGTVKIYTGKYMDWMLLSYSHSLFGTGTANTEFFVIPGNTIKEQPKDAQGTLIPTSKWNHTKRSLAIFIDHNLYSSQSQTSLIAIPVFKSGSGLTQLTPIDTFYKRRHDRYATIPIENREELFYGNVEYYLLYSFDPSNKENPYKPYSNPKLPSTNKFAPNELKIGGLNEIIKFLEITERICQSTTSYSNTGDPGYERSPTAFLKQLAGFILSYPEHGLEIFDKLGGFEAMNKVQQFYPLHSLTNNMQEGLVAHQDLFRKPINIINKCNAIIDNPEMPKKKKKEAETRRDAAQKTLDRNRAEHPEAWAFYQILPHNEWIPAKINGFIFLLSIIGAERVGGDSCIPMKWHGPDDNGFFAFSLNDEVKEKEEGVAIFKPNEFKDLDKLGYPVKIVRDENNKPVLTKNGKYELTYFFKDPSLEEKKTFEELELEERKQVMSLNLHYYKKDATPFVSPYLIRKVFGKKIKINGTPLVEPPVSDKPEENCLDWYKAVTKCETIPSTRGSGRSKVVYAFSKFLAGKLLELNLDSAKNSQLRFELLNLAIEMFYKKIPVEITKMWNINTKTHKNLNILRSIQQLFIILDMTNTVAESAISQKVGQKNKKSGKNTFYINLVNKISEATKIGSVYENTSLIFKEALTYMINEMHKNPNTAFQAFMLHNIIKLGSVASTIESLRPDDVLHGEAKTLWTKQLSIIMKEKIKVASENLKKYTFGSMTVKFLYGQEIVAMLQYEGCDETQISNITGFTPTEVKQLMQEWKARCDKEKIDERMAQEKFMSTLNKLCR